MTFLNILLVVVGFSFIIFIHELGHFLAARRAGIQCPVFSIGFPLPEFLTKPFRIPDRFRNIFSFKRGETEWRFGWIPFGGFVQMKGQSDTPTGLDDNAGSTDDFRNVSYPNKVLVISGGVIMNAITGVIFFILAFMVFGVTFIEPEVGGFFLHDSRTKEATAAWISGEIKPGDRVLKVNGVPVTDFEDVQYEAFFSTGSVQMDLRRPDGSEYTTTVPLNHVHPRFDVALPPLMPRTELLIGEDESKRSGGKLRPKDRLLKVNGTPVLGAQDLAQTLAGLQGGATLTLTVQDLETKGEPREVTFNPRGRVSTAFDYRLGMAFESGLKIDAVRKNGPADTAGVQQGDVITKVRRMDGKPIRRAMDDGWREVRSSSELRSILAENLGSALALGVRRGGGDAVVENVTAVQDSAGSAPTIGVVFTISEAEKAEDEGKAPPVKALTVVDVLPGSPADRAGIAPGDVIADVPGTDTEVKKGGFFGLFASTVPLSVAQRFDLALAKLDERAVAEKPPEPIKLGIKKLGTDESVIVSLEPVFTGEGSQPLMVIETDIRRTEPLTFGFGESIAMGFEVTHKKVVRILQTLKGLVSGQVAITNLAGPVMIAKASYDLTKYGFGTLLFFLGFISINLAIVNFLPIPVLDGGLFVIATIERIKGSPLNERVMGWLNLASFLFVVGLMLFVVFNDIRNLMPL